MSWKTQTSRYRPYPRVLGQNILANLNVSTHHRSGTLSDDSGRTWKLWTFADELSATTDLAVLASSYMDRRTLSQAVEDYRHGVLIKPLVKLPPEQLFEICRKALQCEVDWSLDQGPRLSMVRNSVSLRQQKDTTMKAILLIPF